MADVRYALHPNQFRSLQSQELRDAFLVENIFKDDEVSIVYSHYDRLIIGGIKPVSKEITLGTYDELKAEFFLQRREIGIINVGGKGKVTVDGESISMDTKDTLYIGRGVTKVAFTSLENSPALFYFNSSPAHATHPTRKIALKEAETVELGSLETSNHRIIKKVLVNSVVSTCQLQMGITELQKGRVWNTMPPHVHDRRMEAYFYFDLPDNHIVCHFMGEPQETRHLFVKNHNAVICPPWSIHSGAGTSNYTFVWGMAGENLDYGDMDQVAPGDLR